MNNEPQHSAWQYLSADGLVHVVTRNNATRPFPYVIIACQGGDYVWLDQRFQGPGIESVVQRRMVNCIACLSYVPTLGDVCRTI